MFENQYRHLDKTEFDAMFAEREQQMPRGKAMQGIANYGQATYLRKFAADFTVEMTRSVRLMLKEWMK